MKVPITKYEVKMQKTKIRTEVGNTHQYYHGTGNKAQPKTQEQEISSERIKDKRQNIYSMLLENSNLLSEKHHKIQSKVL